MQRLFARTAALATSLALVLAVVGTAEAQSQTAPHYRLTNLVSNQTGKAIHKDPLLVNAWGLVYAPGSPIWVSDEGSGWSTLYDGSGNPQSLKVVVPPASGTGAGQPTGIVYNGSQQFVIHGWVSAFLFATLDGTIQGWSSFSPSSSIIAVNKSASHASYNGLAITSKTSGNFLYATDINNKRVDVYDGNFKFVKSFTDPSLPSSFVPFGIQDIHGLVLVAFADSAGGPGGFIDIFSEGGTLLKHFTHGAPLNQPWGFAVAPSNFGPLSGTLLISNNTNTGTINGFDLKTGKFVGTLKDGTGKAFVIDQLWGIEFGGGTAANGNKNQLFFTAGPNNNVNGTLGVIEFK
jgi:uncharacterized protein (TIGR03118 family)